MTAKLRQVWQEIQMVVLQRQAVDSVVPPLLFVALYATLGWRWAAVAACVVSGIAALLRWRRGQRIIFALGGVAGTAAAAFLALLWGRASAFFLPGLFGALVTALVAAISALMKRPLVALTSHLARRWPLNWYWHPLVRPAYGEVTWFWALFSVARAWLQARLLAGAQDRSWALLLMGWPLTIVLLIASYLYGSWRLRKLGGPSVDEFASNTPEPWQSQQQGF